MAKQPAGAPVAPMPPPVVNAAGNPDGNPARAPEQTTISVDGHPVSPAVARSRAGAAAAQGHGGK